jgi:serine/threonine protein kinase
MAVIHGDIKPDNILIFPDTHGSGVMAKLCDFGFSSISTPEDQDARRPLGRTDAWAAPEQLDSERALPAFTQDAYSFGLVVAYIITSGRRDLQDLIDQANYSPVRLIAEMRTCIARHRNESSGYPADFSGRICALVSRCLAPLPGDRPKNLEFVRKFLRGDGNLEERGTLHETVIPLPRSISRMVFFFS